MSSELIVPQSIDQLTRMLIDRKILLPGDLQPVLGQLGRSASSAQLLDHLEKQQLLTPFQIKKIERGESDMLVLGGCKLLYQNASGSFARVYRACRIDNGQMIGVKLLRERWSNDRDTVQLFQREGEIGKRLKHPNIVPIFEVGTSGKHHFLTMEFVEGGNLRDFLKIRKKLVPEEALLYGLHIARALEAALALGVTHRDMKSTNVLMSSQGVAKLIDFGLAADDAFLNRTGSPDLAQALEYSTLEKNTGAPKNDPRSDLFFLGVILFELLTGELPYPRTRDRDERKDFSRYRDIRPVAIVDPTLPLPVTRLVSRLLQVNPVQRFQTPGEVAAEIQNALKDLGQKVAAPPGSGALAQDAQVVICVEHRPNRQDLLRQYFTKKGYRVLLLPDADRALSRLKSMTPKGVVFFGDAIGDRVQDDFQQALQLTDGQPVAVAMVLSDGQSEIASQFENHHPRGVVLRQPVSLRDLRKGMEKVFKVS
ncbi:serine/threonine-protein kinase [Planctomicrobium sp. SH661]|uniref:serine/threonine-protein kinase n=1 Tax=Planctomicrobium sp. SH661 TaxID=3448124 RepID=UPI003F5B2DE6